MTTAGLAGQTVLVTGASGGIGQAICAHLDGEGARLVLVARDKGKLEATRAALPGGPHLSIALDVSDEGAWEKAAAEISSFGEVSGVVTAAAVLGPIGAIGSFSMAEFRHNLDINVTGTLAAIAASIGALRSNGGSIVTYSGGGATGPFARYDAYAASKASVVRLTENIAVALAEDGIRANAVAPGFVATAMHEETLAAGADAVGSAYYERTAAALSSGGGDPPEAAARLTAFLLSPSAAGITGKLLSARWDPWEDETFRQRLRDEPDLATLRRIDDQFFTAVSQQ